jgi:phospholipid-binding lipoprotein MlaA
MSLVAATPAAATSNPDPWEPANRRLFKLNKGLDRAVVRPGAVFYHHALTHPIREGVHNVLYNLGEPVTFVNNVLQVRPDRAGRTVVRFVVNSTVGIAGVFDVTAAEGIKREPSGFAQTLARYRAPQGPYIFLPVFGPSSVRDLTGRVVDAVTDPFTWINYGARPYVQAARSVLGGLDQRVALDPVLRDLNQTATDPYATLRSAFLQSSSITGDSLRDARALPDFTPEPPPASPAPAPSPPPNPPQE